MAQLSSHPLTLVWTTLASSLKKIIRQCTPRVAQEKALLHFTTIGPQLRSWRCGAMCCSLWNTCRVRQKNVQKESTLHDEGMNILHCLIPIMWIASFSLSNMDIAIDDNNHCIFPAWRLLLTLAYLQPSSRALTHKSGGELPLVRCWNPFSLDKSLRYQWNM